MQKQLKGISLTLFGILMAVADCSFHTGGLMFLGLAVGFVGVIWTFLTGD